MEEVVFETEPSKVFVRDSCRLYCGVGRTDLSGVVPPEFRDTLRLGRGETLEVLVRGGQHLRGEESSDQQTGRRKEIVENANDAFHRLRTGQC